MIPHLVPVVGPEQKRLFRFKRRERRTREPIVGAGILTPEEFQRRERAERAGGSLLPKVEVTPEAIERARVDLLRRTRQLTGEAGAAAAFREQEAQRPGAPKPTPPGLLERILQASPLPALGQAVGAIGQKAEEEVFLPLSGTPFQVPMPRGLAAREARPGELAGLSPHEEAEARRRGDLPPVPGTVFHDIEREFYQDLLAGRLTVAEAHQRLRDIGLSQEEGVRLLGDMFNPIYWVPIGGVVARGAGALKITAAQGARIAERLAQVVKTGGPALRRVPGAVAEAAARGITKLPRGVAEAAGEAIEFPKAPRRAMKPPKTLAEAETQADQVSDIIDTLQTRLDDMDNPDTKAGLALQDRIADAEKYKEALDNFIPTDEAAVVPAPPAPPVAAPAVPEPPAAAPVGLAEAAPRGAVRAVAPEPIVARAPKEPWFMTKAEFDTALDLARTSEQSVEVELFGVAGAKRYAAAQRTSNSMLASSAQQQAADNLIAQMEAGLTESQRDKLFGIGQIERSAEELAAFRSVFEDVSDLPTVDLISDMRRNLPEVSPRKLRDFLSGSGELTNAEQIAAMKLRTAFRELTGRGLAADDIFQRAGQDLSQSVGLENAQFLLEDWIAAAREGELSVHPPAAAAQPRQIGQVQAGMGIGERPPQGELLGEFRGVAPAQTPLIDAAAIEARQARAAQIARGQQVMPEGAPWLAEDVARASPVSDIPPGVTLDDLVPPPPGGKVPEFPPGGGMPPPGRPAPPPLGSGEGIRRSLELAENLVRQRRPAFLGRMMDHIPGVRHIRGGIAPNTVMNERITAAWVGEMNTISMLGGRSQAETMGLLDELNRAFLAHVLPPTSFRARLGRRIPGVTPDEIVPTRGALLDIPFIGQVVKGDKPGTLGHIIQRASEYPSLTPEQLAVIRKLDDAQRGLTGNVNVGYNAAGSKATRIGEFPTDPLGAHMPNSDISESALEVLGTPMRAAATGRGKPRIFNTWAERLKFDPGFVPDTNVERLQLALTNFKVRVAAATTFREGLGGKTLVQLMDELHPALLAEKTRLTQKMSNLQGRLRTAQARQRQAARRVGTAETEVRNSEKRAEPWLERIEELGEEYGTELSFLSGQIREIQLTARGLEREILTFKGRFAEAGRKAKSILTEMDELAPQLWKLRQRYAAARLGNNVLIREGNLFRYFPIEEAKRIQELLETSNNQFLDVMFHIRNIDFNFDFSPISGVQLPLGVLADTVGVGADLARWLGNATLRRKFLNPLSTRALVETVRNNPTVWGEFFATHGRPMGASPEFAGGILQKLPGWSKVNEGMFTMVTRRSESMWERHVRYLERLGVSHDDAIVAAGDIGGMAIPMWQPRAMGLSLAREKLFRSTTISPSFIVRPIELVNEAMRGYVKMGFRQTLSPKERLAVRTFTNIAGTVQAISLTSALWYAHRNGLDMVETAKQTLPGGRYFASLVLANGNTISLGGPYRSLINMVVPRYVPGSPVPLPFAYFPGWAASRMTPLLRRQYDLLRNKDFYDNRIVSGEFPKNVLQVLAYELEGVLPLTAGSVVAGLRTGIPGGEIAAEAASQFLGQNLRQMSPFQHRNEDVQIWASEQGLDNVLGYYDLKPEDRQRFDAEQPEVGEAIRTEVERQAGQGHSWAQYQVLKNKEFDNQVLRDEAVAAGELNEQPYDAREWLNDYYRAQTRMGGLRDAYEAFVGPTYRDPDSPEEKALNGYYEAMEPFALPGDQFDSEGWEAARLAYMEALPEGLREYVEDRLHPNATPRVRQFLAARETLRPYWEADPRIRRSMRFSRPDIDAALVRWYGYQSVFGPSGGGGREAEPTPTTGFRFKRRERREPVGAGR